MLPVSWIKTVSRLQWRHPIAKRLFDAAANRMRNRDGVIQQGAGKGLRFNAAGSTAGMILGTTEPELQIALKLLLKPGMCVYDVGANVGFFSVIAARFVGSAGHVFSFDPLPSNIKAVAHNARLNGFDHISGNEIALGKVDGAASFIISSDPNWGRLASVGKPGAVIGESKVRVRRIDSLVAEGLTPPSAMKVDVEGAEIDVLEGARDTLRSARPLLFIDLHGTNERVAEILSELDYDARVFRGDGIRIGDASWDSQIIALPRERADLTGIIERVASSKAE
jgi:FkbM family methyltransferase